MKPALTSIRVTQEARKLADQLRVGRETQGDVVLRLLKVEAEKKKRGN